MANVDKSALHDATEAATQEGAAVAFGIAAAVTVLFNTVLAWVKDAYEPLNSFMAALTGHHWWTHGLFDFAIFVIVGGLMLSRSRDAEITPGLIGGLVAAVVVAGLGLVGWFVLI
jgi:hypothetical protein